MGASVKPSSGGADFPLAKGVELTGKAVLVFRLSAMGWLRTVKEMESEKENTTERNRVIGERIRKIRKKHGLSQKELGKLIGLSQGQLYRYETGINQVSAADIYIIAKVIGANIDDFFLFEADAHSAQGNQTVEFLRNISDLEKPHLHVMRIMTRALAS
jgi:transcriptional regulator with XRE-family HTH domain